MAAKERAFFCIAVSYTQKWMQVCLRASDWLSALLYVSDGCLSNNGDLPSVWLSRATNIFLTGLMAASLHTRRMSEPE